MIQRRKIYQTQRYNDITGCLYNNILYNEYLNENKRIIISRWRLSNHNLRIEKGRQTTPFTPRLARVCLLCPMEIEDESHVLFQCPVYVPTRVKYRNYFARYISLDTFLNPRNIGDANILGDILKNIEDIRESIDLG